MQQVNMWFAEVSPLSLMEIRPHMDFSRAMARSLYITFNLANLEYAHFVILTEASSPKNTDLKTNLVQVPLPFLTAKWPYLPTQAPDLPLLLKW